LPIPEGTVIRLQIERLPSGATPKLRSPEAADRWTWLLLVASPRIRVVAIGDHTIGFRLTPPIRRPLTEAER